MSAEIFSDISPQQKCAEQLISSETDIPTPGSKHGVESAFRGETPDKAL